MKDLTFVTGNPGKAQQIKKYLRIPIGHHELDLDEIQSLNLDEIIAHKAKEAYKKLQKPVLVDDTSLTIHTFGHLPGPFIKWFLKELGDTGICKLVANLEDKSATAELALGLFDGVKMNIFKGVLQGSIAASPAGDNGFGWDTIFIPEGYNQTRAQMSGEDYDATSPRDIAIQKLAQYLRENYGL